jgi:hypothetical protein
MKRHDMAFRMAGVALSLALGILLLQSIGCATRGKSFWNAQVGKLTYDQAVLDMGPPDKRETLSDGTRVAEWLTSRGQSGRAVAVSSGYYHGSTVWMEPSAPDTYMRLTFGPDSRLTTWRRVFK